MTLCDSLRVKITFKLNYLNLKQACAFTIPHFIRPLLFTILFTIQTTN